MSGSECRCSRPIQDDGAICWTCARSAADDLVTLRWLVDELDVTASRQSRVGTGGGGGRRGGAERPLPFDPRASELRATIRAGLDWLEVELRGELGPAALRAHEDAETIASTAGRWVADATRAVDLPPERRYVGTCDVAGCAGHLFAERWQPTVVCGLCGAQHGVEETTARMLEQIPDRLMTAAEIERLSDASDWLGPEPVTAKEVLRWQDEGRLLRHGTTRLVLGRQRPLYRLGDVQELAAERDRRRHDRKTRKISA
ncbi:hypothetical protein EEW87_16375 [Janibacter melonis]|uniref:Uncharacterized protein n=1 Tax=Janibacter melonis TaxID=262209 RepID=A0A650GD29_9MICO|nr:hypothetical protein [Janibacter melonis]QGX08247.1 hypothetical protein EEW87_16375 [Janibacter melonis]